MSQPNQVVTPATLGMATYDMNRSIHQAQRAFNELLRTCLGHHGLTVPIWSVLGSLYATDILRPRDLAVRLHMKPPYISVLIRQLEQDSLVECIVIPDDERGKFARLTATGRVTVERVEAQLEHCITEQFVGVSLEELKTFFAMSEFIAQNIRHGN